MPITITAPSVPEGPDESKLTWIHLKLSSVPSDEWIASLYAAHDATKATDRPSRFYVEGDQISFAINGSSEASEADEHVTLIFRDVIRRWIELGWSGPWRQTDLVRTRDPRARPQRRA